MSYPSEFLYVPASARASQRIIEQSSYTTTPNQSPGDTTPPSGEFMYNRPLNLEEIDNSEKMFKKRSADAKVSAPSKNEGLYADSHSKDPGGGREKASDASPPDKQCEE